MDVNDQNNGFAFTSVLRNTQDSVAEFRVTKSGTNTFHGSLYEYNRNTDLAANEYFLKASEPAAGLPNQRSQLIRNVFGGSVGGPVWKNRLFLLYQLRRPPRPRGRQRSAHGPDSRACARDC